MRVEGVRLSLWRAAALYRVVTLVFCDYLIFLRWSDLYERPAVAYAAGAAMTLATAAVAALAVSGRAHRPGVVIADVVVTAALTLLSIPAQTPAQQHGGMPTLTTLWAAGPALEAGFLAGWLGGLGAAIIQVAAAVVVRTGYDGRTVVSALILLIAASVVGYVATLVTRSEAELAAAVTTRAAMAERERLARTVHDGVLQILGLVHRAGRDADGEWGRLAAEAGAQEARLRALITSRTGDREDLDLLQAVRSLRSERVTVSAPSTAPPLPPAAVADLVAAIKAALHNVEQHAGPQAHAWVSIEELDTAVQVSVRDDGVGFANGRLEAAERAGRLGFSSSVRGRITQLGGQVTVTSQTGQGTVVQMTVPTR